MAPGVTQTPPTQLRDGPQVPAFAHASPGTGAGAQTPTAVQLPSPSQKLPMHEPPTVAGLTQVDEAVLQTNPHWQIA